MGYRLNRRSAALCKIEGTYGTDPVPVGATDAIYIYDLKVTPQSNVRQERKPVRPFFGDDVPAIGGTPVKVDFSVPIAGGGAAGTAPGYDTILRACGRSKTVNAGVSVVYAPISSGFESATMYVNKDGVQHIITGFRGDASIEFNHEQMPMYKVSGQGMYNAPTDVALPALTFGATWVKPLVQNKVNTPTFTLAGIALVLQKLSYKTGYGLDWKDWVNNSEQVRLTDRPKVVGSIVVQADTIAAKDWFVQARAATTGVLQLIHGTAAGNKWQLDAAVVIVTDPAYEDAGGILMLKMGIEMYPGSAGNNEFSETVL